MQNRGTFYTRKHNHIPYFLNKECVSSTPKNVAALAGKDLNNAGPKSNGKNPLIPPL